MANTFGTTSRTIRTIINSQATVVVNEKSVGETMYPGHVVFLNSLSKFMLQGASVYPVQMQVLQENDFEGQGIDDTLGTSDIGRAAVLRSGDRFYCRLAASQTLKIGDTLGLASGGVFTASGGSNLAAVKCLATATSSSANDLLLVEVL